MSQNKVALITGAGGGLGSATARALAEQGYDLVLMSRRGCAEIAEETGGVGVAGSVLSDAYEARGTTQIGAALSQWGALGCVAKLATALRFCYRMPPDTPLGSA